MPFEKRMILLFSTMYRNEIFERYFFGTLFCFSRKGLTFRVALEWNSKNIVFGEFLQLLLDDRKLEIFHFSFHHVGLGFIALNIKMEELHKLSCDLNFHGIEDQYKNCFYICSKSIA